MPCPDRNRFRPRYAFFSFMILLLCPCPDFCSRETKPSRYIIITGGAGSEVLYSSYLGPEGSAEVSTTRGERLWSDKAKRPHLHLLAISLAFSKFGRRVRKTPHLHLLPMSLFHLFPGDLYLKGTLQLTPAFVRLQIPGR